MSVGLDRRIAIVSMAGRFPGADGVEAYWENCRAGRVSISRFSADELRENGVAAAELEQTRYVPAKGVLSDSTRFDAFLFGYGPSEASAIDPQQRLFLECSFTALEEAACDPRRFRGQIGVFAGQFLSTYLVRYLSQRPDVVAQVGLASVFQGNTVDQLATRVAYKLDLHGPAVTVQTACSTSLVAAHLACQSLLAYECDLALAGGVMATFPRCAGYLHEEGGLLSREGVCRPFDARADGTVFSDGVGVVALRRLEDALADGDPIRGVILASAVGNDGGDKVGYSAPCVRGQVRVLGEALALADIEPGSVGFVETHGTGTPMGDPIELEALRVVYRSGGEGELCLGAVKGNIGHLDVAAGVASLIKAVCALERGVVPPLAGFASPNPELPIERARFVFPTEARPWPGGHALRRAAVSAFGVGGTNAHLILEEPPGREAVPTGRRCFLVPLSAKTVGALEHRRGELGAFLGSRPETSLAELEATLVHGRRTFERRMAVAATSVPQLLEALASVSATDGTAQTPLVFLIPGQGALRGGLGRRIYEHEPAFREPFDACTEYLRRRAGVDVGRWLFANAEDAARAAAELVHTRNAQPASFALSYALARWLATHGIAPAAVIGHSLGEYVAACLAGVFDLESALDLVVARGALMDALPRGAMLAVAVSAARARELSDGGISLAADNGPAASVVSGPVQAIDALATRLRAEGVAATRLETSHAFHSALMEPMLDAFAARLQAVRRHPPERPYVSSVTGEMARAEDVTSVEYWLRHTREPVRFREALAHVQKLGAPAFVEVGAGRHLSTLVRLNAEANPAVTAALLDVGPGEDTQRGLLGAIGRLWAAGVAGIDLGALARGERAARLALPTYGFEGERYFVSAVPAAHAAPPSMPPATVEEDPRRWLKGPTFRRRVLEPSGRLGEKRLRWLLYLNDPEDDGGLGDLLESRGQVVTKAVPGTELRRISRGVYTVRPDDVDDVLALLAELRALVRAPNVIAHMLLAGRSARGSDASGIAPLGSFHALACALARESTTAEVRLGVVTQGVYDVLGTEPVTPRHALVLGPCLVFPQEMSSLRTRHIDLGDDHTLATIGAERLAEEILADPGRVALRGRYGFTPALEPLDADGRSEPFRRGGLYAITGGLGGLGLALAERLVRDHDATVLALGRRGLPPREEWREVAPCDPFVARVTARIDEIEEGAAGRIVPLSADVTDADALREALSTARLRFGPLRGVIHAAGVPGGSLAIRDAPDDVGRVLAAKVQGTEALAAALDAVGLEPGELDFVALCSSVAALVGGPGNWSYVAANAYLDAFAAARARSSGTAWVSVAWDTVRDVGMAANAEVPAALRELYAARLALGIAPQQAAAALALALGAGRPQVVVSPLGVEQLDQLAVALGELGGRSRLETYQRPDLGVEYTAPRNELEARIAEAWSVALGMTPIGVHDSFLELGGHSLLAAQLVARLRDELDVDLPLSVLFEHQTVAALAEEVERTILAEFANENGSDADAPASSRDDGAASGSDETARD